jgi:hypothetical protein
MGRKAALAASIPNATLCHLSEPRVPKWTNAPFTPEELERIADMLAARHNLRLEDARKLVARTRATKRNPLLEQQWVAVTHRMREAIRRGEAKPARACWPGSRFTLLGPPRVFDPLSDISTCYGNVATMRG